MFCTIPNIIFQGFKNVAEFLIKKGANIEIVGKNGDTALTIAIEKGKKNRIEKLKISNTLFRARNFVASKYGSKVAPYFLAAKVLFGSERILFVLIKSEKFH